jgi:hypothetical protein
MLGPGKKVMYRCLDEDGTMKVDVDTIMSQVAGPASQRQLLRKLGLTTI